MQGQPQEGWGQQRRRWQLRAALLGPPNPIPLSYSRPKGTMVTYGGMAKQPVMVPVVSTEDVSP